jgi:uncharacterized NAD(P)/FAD-binding protein YdhS
MHGPTASERLRRTLWTAIAEDDWAQTDLDSAISDYVREAQERGLPLAEICRSLRVHVQQVGLGLPAQRYETISRHVTALAETAYQGVFRGRHSTHTVNVPGAGEES